MRRVLLCNRAVAPDRKRTAEGEPSDGTEADGESEFAARLRGVSTAGAALIVGLSVLALLGWALHVPAFNRLAPDAPPVKANAALCFLLASLSLLAYSSSRPGSWLRRAGAACAAVVVLVGVVTLAEYLVNWHPGIDRLLFSDKVSHQSPYPGRPAANAAVGFVLLGGSLLLWDVRLGRRWATNMLAWFGAVVGILSLTGYAIGAESLMTFDAHQQISVNASIALSVLPLAILLARPDRGATALLAATGPAGAVLRRLLPAAFALPVMLATLTLAGRRLGLFSERFGVWLFASGITLALVAVVWLVAVASERAGVQRSQLEGMMLALARTASDAIAVTDRSGRIIYANGALEAMFGYEDGALVGRQSEILFSDRDRAREGERLAQARSGGERAGGGRTYELTGTRADGREFRIELSAAAWTTGGEPVAARIIRDVSARHRAEQKVQGLLESAPDAIVVVDRHGQIVVANARTETMFGYTRDELIGQPVEMLVPEAKRDAHVVLRSGYATDPRPRHSNRPGDFTARRKDGSVFPAEITLNPIQTDEGLLVSSAIRDVSDRRRAEEANARLAAIVSSSPNAIIGVSPDGLIESWNGGAERLYGYNTSDAVGQPITIINAPEHANGTVHLDAALAGETVAFESEDVRSDGSRVEAAVTISPVRERSGEIIGVSCLAQDISERKRAERAMAHLAAIVESSDDAIYGKTIEGQITSWNRGAQLIYGYSAAETLGHHVSMLAPSEYHDETIDLLRKVAAGERLSHLETIRRHRDGRLIDVSLTLSPIRDAEGRVIGASTIAHDMTDRRAAERALAEAEESFRRAFDEAPIGMALIAADGVLEKVNAALGGICGYARHELQGLELRSILHPADIENGVEAFRALATGATERLALDLRMIPAVGTSVDVAVHATRLASGSSGGVRLLCQFLDVTDRKRYEQRLQFMADHDPLTGLLNRRKFEAELERHVEHVKRYGPEGAVLVLDIDHFKTVNDTLGHNAGDQLIVSIASVLRQRLRASDTLARLGGDEFAVLLPKADHGEAAEVAEAIVSAIRTTSSLLDGERRKLTTSLGIAMFTADSDQLSGESILIEADLAMYDAKDAGRDQYAFYETSEHRISRTQARLTWSNRIEHALENDRFVLLAQPILDLRTERIRQYELLIRMLDERGELIPPAAFLYIAERFGSIARLDEWVAAHAIDLISEHPELHLEINISGKSLGDHALLTAIDDRLRASQIDPTHLIFEVTETAAVANLTHAQAFAQHLRDRGCRFALDDFGAGFGSFYYLKHLPFDYVKIDGEFVKHATGGQIDRLVIQAVVRIAQGLGKETIAEFVTNDQTQRMVRHLGVDYAQGYHIGKPAPIEAILDRELPEQI